MDPKTLKAELLITAYEAAAAALRGAVAVDGVPINFTSAISDPGQQKLNVLVYETAKVHYAALLKALADDTVWPDPPASSAAGVSVQAPAAAVAVLAALAKSAPTGSPIVTLATQLVTALLAGVQPAAAAPTAPVPAPGSDIPAPAPSSPATPAQPAGASALTGS